MIGPGYGSYISTDVSKPGLLQTYFSLLTLNCSRAQVGKCSNVYNGKLEYDGNNYWHSTGPDPYYQVSLNKGYIYPTNGAILSCQSTYCLRNFSILGIEKGEDDFKEICSYNATSSHDFYGKIRAYPCLYEKPLKAVKILATSTNSAGNFDIALYSFDFYGYIWLGFCTIFNPIRISITPLVIFLLF